MMKPRPARAGVQQCADGTLRVGSERAVDRHALGGERVQRSLLGLDLVLGGRLRAHPRAMGESSTSRATLSGCDPGVAGIATWAPLPIPISASAGTSRAAQPLEDPRRGHCRTPTHPGAMMSVQPVVAVVVTVPRAATGSSPGVELGLLAHQFAVEDVAAVDRVERPIPRRSNATIGWDFNTSAPERDSHTGSCTDEGRSDPVVNTSGPHPAGSARSGPAPRRCSVCRWHRPPGRGRRHSPRTPESRRAQAGFPRRRTAPTCSPSRTG